MRQSHFSVLALAIAILATGVSARGLPTQKVLTIDVAQAMAQAAMLQCRANGYRLPSRWLTAAIC